MEIGRTRGGGGSERRGGIVKDELFGELAWDRIEHAWLGKARLPDLLGLGAALRDTPGGLIRDDYDPQKLFHEGAFRLVVRPGDGRPELPPSDEQRAAWQTFLDNRTRIVDDIMSRALDAYVRQRPARLYWWTQMYGGDDPLLPEALPDIQTAAELRRLVRPFRFIVRELRGGEAPPPPVVIQFDAAWDRGGGSGAVLRGDDVVSFGPPPIVSRPGNAVPLIDVPPFGKLKCYTDRSWDGQVHFEPFARFRCIVDERERYAHYRRDPGFRSAPEWEFIEGIFDLEFTSPAEGQPAPQQVAAFEAFMRDPQQSADVVLDAILAYYREVFDTYHEAYGDPDEANRLMPPIDSPQELRDLITFQSMVISTPLEEGESAFIGLGFACAWDEEHGLYVRWRDGKVEDVGGVETIL